MSGLPKRQRVAAYAVILRDGRILLSRLAPTVTSEELWTLPGGGLDHGEDPRDAVVREVHEECGVDCAVGELVAVHDDHFSGTAPSGRYEDFHAISLVFEATLADGVEPRAAEVDGTTDAVEWVPLAEVASGGRPVLDVVNVALAAR